MADIYDIVYYGDERLIRENKKIGNITENIKNIARKMIRTMKKKDGIGLAGPQVGINKKIAVIDMTFGQKDREEEYLILIDPEIKEYSSEKNIMEEGCLSFPELFIPVERSVKIKISTKNISGEKISFEAEGFLARVLQHEVDHLNSIVFVDRISPVKKMEISSELKKIKEKAKEVRK